MASPCHSFFFFVLSPQAEPPTPSDLAFAAPCVGEGCTMYALPSQSYLCDRCYKLQCSREKAMGEQLSPDTSTSPCLPQLSSWASKDFFVRQKSGSEGSEHPNNLRVHATSPTNRPQPSAKRTSSDSQLSPTSFDMKPMSRSVSAPAVRRQPSWQDFEKQTHPSSLHAVTEQTEQAGKRDDSAAVRSRAQTSPAIMNNGLPARSQLQSTSPSAGQRNERHPGNVYHHHQHRLHSVPPRRAPPPPPTSPPARPNNISPIHRSQGPVSPSPSYHQVERQRAQPHQSESRHPAHSRPPPPLEYAPPRPDGKKSSFELKSPTRKPQHNPPISNPARSAAAHKPQKDKARKSNDDKPCSTCGRPPNYRSLLCSECVRSRLGQQMAK